MKKFLILALLFAQGAAAAEKSYLAAPPPRTARLNEIVSFKPAEGWHFNLKAPQDCGAAPAFEVKDQSLRCQFTSGGEQLVSLNVCDRSGGSCASEEFKVSVSGRPAARRAAAPAAAEGAGLEGFLLNAPREALLLAQKENKPLFIDFFGRWCPPCRLMEDTVLGRPEFLEASAGMVRVQLDIDLPVAREWLARFKVRSYPTYLVADPQLREIGRYSGSTGLAAFSAWVRRQAGWKHSPLAEARKKGAALDEAGRVRVAESYVAEENWKAARELLAGSSSRYASCLEAYASAREKSAGKAEGLAAVYAGLIERFDGRDGKDAMASVPGWVAELHKLDPAAAKPHFDVFETLEGRLLASGEAAAEGVAGPDVPLVLAMALEEAGLRDRARTFYLKASDGYRQLAEAAPGPERAKGLRMMQARYLSAAGDYAGAEAVYAGLTGNFPAEYAFHRSRASVLAKLDRKAEALAEISKAAELSYGDIRLDILLQKAQLEMAGKEKAAALATLRGALAEADLPAERSLGTHGAYRRLKDYLAKVEAGE